MLAGCDTAAPNADDVTGETDIIHLAKEGPPGAAPGTCWGKNISPATIETVTEQVLVEPAVVGADGVILSPAAYKTETRQSIVRERRKTWFETPCPEVLTAEFVASLQRALAVRNKYSGPITGQMDTVTRLAVRRFQEPLGLNSALLSLTTARNLGLVAVERDTG